VLFVVAVRDSYMDNPYHNFTHAFDVTQAMFVTLTKMNVQRYLRSIDVFAIMVASLCHDCGHPGLTNSYLIATNSPLAQRYKDQQSVLEHHHCSIAFELILEMEPNLLTNLSMLDRVEFKNAMETCILATDMAKHNTFVEQIASLVESLVDDNEQKLIDSTNVNHRELLMISLLKFCDISNVFRENSLATAWMTRITEEYFSQGDEMHQRDMVVPDIMNRNHTSTRQETTRLFIKQIVVPFFDRCIVPLLSDEYARMLRSNLMHNEKMLKKKKGSRNRS